MQPDEHFCFFLTMSYDWVASTKLFSESVAVLATMTTLALHWLLMGPSSAASVVALQDVPMFFGMPGKWVCYFESSSIAEACLGKSFGGASRLAGGTPDVNFIGPCLKIVSEHIISP